MIDEWVRDRLVNRSVSQPNNKNILDILVSS